MALGGPPARPGGACQCERDFELDDLLLSEWADACKLLQAALTSPDPDAYLGVRASWQRVEQTIRAVLGDAGALPLADDDSAFLRALAAGEEQLPTELLERLATDPALIVRLAAAGNPHTPSSALAVLYREGPWHVRVELAGNPSVPGWMLSSLAADRFAPVRAAVARQHVRDAILAQLAADKDWRVRAAAASNTSLAAERLKELGSDTDARVASAARKTMALTRQR